MRFLCGGFALFHAAFFCWDRSRGPLSTEGARWKADGSTPKVLDLNTCHAICRRGPDVPYQGITDVAPWTLQSPSPRAWLTHQNPELSTVFAPAGPPASVAQLLEPAPNSKS